MDKSMQRRVILGTTVVVALVGIVIFCIQSMNNSNPKNPPAWLRYRQPLTVTQTSTLQTQNLATLCKVWGFTKYYHPALATGKLDWDEQLLGLLPQLLDCSTADQADKLLTDWVNRLGKVKKNPPPDYSKMQVALTADLGWMAADGLSPELTTTLANLTDTHIINRTKGPVQPPDDSKTLTPSFFNENAYPGMDYTDAGMRLLGLFRYWNIIQFYYPYRNIPDTDWNQVLVDFIPRFLAIDDELSYKLLLCELTTYIQDSHANTFDVAGTLWNYFGSRIAPLNLLLVDGQVVVGEIPATRAEKLPVQAGDVVMAIDGKPTDVVIAEKLKHISLSSAQCLADGLNRELLRTNATQLPLTIRRDEQVLEVMVDCLEERTARKVIKPSWELLEGNIGLINPAFLQPGEIDTIMPQLWDTKGLVVDLRQYPSDFITHTLAAYLLPAPTPFVYFTIPNPTAPGGFLQIAPVTAGKEGAEPYKGKLVLLMNEQSISNAEFTVMSLRQTPGSVVVGSRSIGADGDIVTLPLPGGVTTVFTGLGVYTPDGGETQRVGLIPDVEVYPTLPGLRARDDELLDKAIQLIANG